MTTYYTAWRGRPLPDRDHPASLADRQRHSRQDSALLVMEAALGLSADEQRLLRLPARCKAGHPMREDPTNVRLDLDAGTFHCRHCERPKPKPVPKCRKGKHLKTPANTGSRGRCLACHREYMKQRYQTKHQTREPVAA
ncbi:hypothetical protein [Kocuria sp. CPCC 204721]|uniref:hypothetical protein n=1 Tax=Kocuria sp. CPCC 204721 TaxID=3073548 RepID=UPI0034D62085